MASTDPIADMLTSIRNANHRFFEKVDVPASKVKEELLKIIKEQGYIINYKKIEDKKQGVLRIYLKYQSNKIRVISGLKRISRPGLRTYRTNDKLPKVNAGLGIAIISTSQGVMTCGKARDLKIGGEVMCYIW
ncbi:30S ribosomal protein S8 [bacterium]